MLINWSAAYLLASTRLWSWNHLEKTWLLLLMEDEVGSSGRENDVGFAAGRCDRLSGQFLGRSCLSRLSTFRTDKPESFDFYSKSNFEEKSDITVKRSCQPGTSTF
jgi:hypothetical protein